MQQLQQLIGEISQMKQQAKRMQRQLDTDYKDIHGEYIDCLVKWKVSADIVSELLKLKDVFKDRRHGQPRSGEVRQGPGQVSSRSSSTSDTH